MRIARELHDVVAHSMAMINVQATAASIQLAADPASAAEAIQAIRRAGKSGLRELRTILEALRPVDAGSPWCVTLAASLRPWACVTTAAVTSPPQPAKYTTSSTRPAAESPAWTIASFCVVSTIKS
jgi:hypothetical protein